MKCETYLLNHQYCSVETDIVCKNCKRPICLDCLAASRSPSRDLCLKCHEAAYYAYQKYLEEEKKRRGY